MGNCLNRDLLDWRIFRIADCGESGERKVWASDTEKQATDIDKLIDRS